MARGEGSDPAVDDRRGRGVRPAARLRPPARASRPRHEPDPASAPTRPVPTVPARASAVGRRRLLRPRLPSPAHAPSGAGYRARAARRAATDRDGRLRSRPSAVGVHAHRRSVRRRRHGARGIRDEGASFGDRRRGWHGAARAPHRPHARRGRADRRCAGPTRGRADGRAHWFATPSCTPPAGCSASRAASPPPPATRPSPRCAIRSAPRSDSYAPPARSAARSRRPPCRCRP